MSTVTTLPADGGFLDGLQTIALDALQRETSIKLPNATDKANEAAIQIAQQTATAKNTVVANSAGLSQKQMLLIGGGVLMTIGFLVWALRK